MRGILFGIIAVAIGCSGSETTSPAATPVPPEVTPLPPAGIPVPGFAGCAVSGGDSPPDNPLAPVSFVMVLVNGQPLPVHSPWGVGDWDYDGDAGTWQMIGATLTLKANCTFTHDATHRAASGNTINVPFSGTYTRASSASLRFVEDGLAYPPEVSRGRVIAYSAEIIGNLLVMKVWDGMTFTFEQSRRNAGA